MPRRRATIPELSTPLSYADALAVGISRGRLAGPHLIHPYWGVVQEGEGDGTLLARCRQYAARMATHQFFSHGTALRLYGAAVPRREELMIHVAAHRPAREPRTRGVIGHRLQTREPATRTIHGLRLEHPARAWRQAGSRWDATALTVAGDFLIARRRPLTSLGALRRELVVMGATPALWQALDQLRDGSESPEETRLRLVLVEAGLPEPELNAELRDERRLLIARLDMFYRRFGVAVEYDGRQHADSRAQFERDADRWEAIRDAGVLLVRILRHHPREVRVAKVRRALESRGWRPPP